jgi:hypothetical protein
VCDAVLKGVRTALLRADAMLLNLKHCELINKPLFLIKYPASGILLQQQKNRLFKTKSWFFENINNTTILRNL